jgi:aspartate kinase
MGRLGDPYATDTLLALIHSNGGTLSSREQDRLLGLGETLSACVLTSLLTAEGIPCVTMTGREAGIITDDHYGQARILTIDPGNMLDHLAHGEVVIVTGFQGVTEEGVPTTLGRGGSDTSATALGAALYADRVDIYSDVTGILTADPRIVANARPLDVVSYTEICNMARQGAKVLHPRAVEIAQEAHIPLRVRSTFTEGEGTRVTALTGLQGTAAARKLRDKPVTGIANYSGITQITVYAKESALAGTDLCGDRSLDADAPWMRTAQGASLTLQMEVFQAMARHHISVDFINVTPGAAVYTVFDEDAEQAVNVLQAIGYFPIVVPNCAKVSVIGGGMNGIPGIMALIGEALTEEGVQILQSADSNATIWVLVRAEDMAIAARALHDKFQLECE